MIAKNCAAVVCAAATIGQAAAGVAHRHHMNLHQKKDVYVQTDVVVVTDVVTIFVTDGADAATPAPAATPSSQAFSPQVYPESSITISSTVSSSASVAAAAAPATPTTFASVVKPAEVKTDAVASAASSVAAAISSVASYIVEPAVSTSSSAAAATSTGSSGTGVTGAKRGLVYNDASLLSLFDSACSWVYNWDSSTADIPSGLDYVPMLWGLLDVHTSVWESNANQAISNGATHLLSFNEPDNDGQANLSPSAAAAGHKQYMNGFSGKAKISTPAVTSTQKVSGRGLDWLAQWKTACDGGCDYDFCAVHWYGDASQTDNFLEFVDDAVTACDGKPIWITEFATTSGDASTFLGTVIPELEKNDSVERYSYFWVAAGSLLEDSTKISAVGTKYISL